MTQESLDAIKLSKDSDLEKYKRYQIEKNSGFIVNGSMAIVGGTGSGKTTLLSKLVRLYDGHIKGLQIFYFHGGDGMDQTFTHHTKGTSIKSIDSSKMEKFVLTYSKVKKNLIEFIQLLQKPGYWSENLTVMKKELDGANMIKVAAEFVEKYSKPQTLETIDIGPMVQKSDVVPSLLLFDDLTQLGNYTGKYAKDFLKIVTSNTRHFRNTSIFSMQRYTNLQSDVRKNINAWAIGYGVVNEDLKIMLSETVIPHDVSTNEIYEEYDSLQRYEFLIINAEFDILTVIKVNR